MVVSRTQKKSFRHRLRNRLNRFRRNLQGPLPLNDDCNPADSDLITKSIPAPTDIEDVQIQVVQRESYANVIRDNSTTNQPHFGENDSNVLVSSDLWSAAYREAVDSLGDDIDIAILKGQNVAQLFRDLEDMDKEATQESAFLRGVRYLRSIQVPLETFKLALDLASPLTSLEPTTAAVFGVVRNVTAIAISFATADLEFAKQIGEMLEQLSYIDDCDTLGQKSGKKDIHQALVMVYKKLLEFYKAAFDILNRKGAKLVRKIILEDDCLPSILQDFLRYADTLHKLVQKATWEIVDDIKTMLYDHEIARWLGSGRMSQQNQYHASLRELRADQACEFLLLDRNFIDWSGASDSQQLVIFGDMGSGKTVSAAFLVDELSRRNKHQLPQPKICYYYCRDDETGQAIHIFPALILSLLHELPGLKKSFFGWYKQAQTSGDFDPATNVRRLEEFLQQVLETVDRPLFIVIDSLDECDRTSRIRLLKLLKTLSDKTPRLKTLVTSRPQEEILEQLHGTARIYMRCDAKRDGLIVRKTVDNQLCYLSKDVKEFVIERVSCLAEGSAIWTKMIIELIQVRGIRALGPMKLFLQGMPLPGQLSELYATLLFRCTSEESENQELATTALRLLAVARRPLSMLELAWATALGTAQQGVTTVATLATLVDYQRVMNLVHPFVARVDFNDVKKRQVQLVHQSVKDFILKELPPNQSRLHGPAISTTIAQGNRYQCIESLEKCALDICVEYLLLHEIGNNSLFSGELLAIEELPQEVDLFNDDDTDSVWYEQPSWEAWEEGMIHFDPAERGFGEFFVYASCYWIEHFYAVTSEPLPSLESIEKLCQAGSTRLDNWIQQNRRPGCTIKPRFEFDTRLYDPLSITSLYGSENMLRHMLKNSSFDKDKFLPEPAIGAADQILQWGGLTCYWCDLPRLRILFLEGELGYKLRNLDFFRLVIKRWSESRAQCRNWEPVFDLIDHVLDALVSGRWGNDLLCIASRAGCMPIIDRLMTRAKNNTELRSVLLCVPRAEEQASSFGNPMHQSIGEAVLGNHVDVVKYLLSEKGIETHLRYRNSRGENVLHLASGLCNPIMFGLLVPHFQEGIHQTDDQGVTPLARVIMNVSPLSLDRHGSVRILLLQDDTDWNSPSRDEQWDPLRIAVRLRDLDMCRLLISTGKMNPFSALTRDSNGRMILKDKVPGDETDTLRMLEMLVMYANTA